MTAAALVVAVALTILAAVLAARDMRAHDTY